MATNETHERALLTTQDEVAEVFNVHRRTVAEWMARGCPGERGRYVIADILEWVMGVLDGRCLHCGQNLPQGHPMRDARSITEETE